MRYRDVVQFEPLETVVQLTSTGAQDVAARLVASYVVSPHMAEVLTALVVPQLQFARAADQKGLLVVGNYGTGKSHLLAVLAAVAERADLAALLRDGSVRAAAAQIAGKFQVVRAEIGSTEMRLRDILLEKIERALAERGIAFHFPTLSEVSNSKEPLLAMLAVFQEHFPEQGLLLVVDELLDFLRGRNEQALILDLGFLRELGEVCADSRLRFVGGIQESLFDSPSFRFAASAVLRVKDRFQQVPISREDITYVVSQRLLRKTEAQREQVRRYLEPFLPLYPDMANRQDAYVELFPVHPAYIRIFGEIVIVEKREVLKTLNREIEARLDDELPTDHPGLLAYDSYWQVIRANPTFRVIAEVRDVLEKSEVLEAKVQSAYTRPAYKPVALRMIHALSVHRLTIGDLRAPIGVTPAELRDDLCLFLPTPEPDADFLEATIGAAIKEISRTVSGQFLSYNPDNDQWYLDVGKDVDYDALIQQRAATLSPDHLDRAYYEVLQRVMEIADAAEHVSGAKIWEYELEWAERRVSRPGYLFLGRPNRRPTAQPPREFYLYFLPPFSADGDGEGVERGRREPDEVYYRLARKDATLEAALRGYAAATALAEQANSAARPVYREKAGSSNPQRPGYLQQALRRLAEQAAGAFEVTYQGTARPAGELLRGRAASLKDLVDQVAARCLAPRFADQLPEYPTFPILVSRANRAATALEAARWIAGGMRTQQGAAILGALELLDGDRLMIDASRYARWFRDQLRQRGEGRVVNRADLINSEYHGSVEYDRRFHLEPEWVVVVLLALVHAGEITLALPGRKLDAASLESAPALGMDTLSRFTYIERPRDLPLAALTALFELLELPAGLIRTPGTHGDAIQRLQGAVDAELRRLTTLAGEVAQGLHCWNAEVLEGVERGEAQARLEGYRRFLDGLQPFNTPGKLKNFPWSAEQVREQEAGRAALAELEHLRALAAELQPLSAYLLQAYAVLPEDDPTAAEIAALQAGQVALLRDAERRDAPEAREQMLREAQALKARYAVDYAQRHSRSRLNVEGDRRRAHLLHGPDMARLRALRAVSILPAAALGELERGLMALTLCTEFATSELNSAPLCPHCSFRPLTASDAAPAAAQLEALGRRLEALEQEWGGLLLANLRDPSVEASLALLGEEERRPLDHLLASGRLPDLVDSSLVRALERAFGGLEKVVVSRDDLLGSLTNGGAPSTIDGLTARLKQFLTARTQGLDPEQVRIVVE